MIRKVVDFALNNRLLVLAATVMVTIWGVISFHNLPVEAYPDIANDYVQIITQWQGRAAEEVEQQVTIPIEIAVNSIPHLQHMRSISMFGLSNLILTFDDDSENDWNRQKVLERLSQAALPDGLTPRIGADFSPVGEIFMYTLKARIRSETMLYRSNVARVFVSAGAHCHPPGSFRHSQWNPRSQSGLPAVLLSSRKRAYATRRLSGSTRSDPTPPLPPVGLRCILIHHPSGRALN